MTYVITTPCVLCIVDLCLTASLLIYLHRAQKTPQQHIRITCFPDSRMMQFNCAKGLCRTLHGGGGADTKSTLRSHHYIGIENLRKYLYGIPHIEITKADLEKKVDEFINDKSDFNNTHIIKSNIQPVSNVPEEE